MAQGMSVWAGALRHDVNPAALFTANNYNTDSRAYWPGDKAGRDPNPDNGLQWPFWMDIGRQAAPFGLWTEDWTGDPDAETWSYHADMLACAAREGAGNSFGGNVVGRTIGELGEAGGKFRAMALLGHGAKSLLWYNHGPEPYFQKFAWSDNATAYRSIAQTNALIGASEPVLYPGQRADSQVALLQPRSAYFWGGRDPEPYFQKDLKGLYLALTHLHYAVDFVDEMALPPVSWASAATKCST